jgi:hypothetical protein
LEETLKKSSLVIFLILITQLTLFAQIEWQENGVPVVQPDSPHLYNPALVYDNYQIVVWSDCRDGIRSIYAQKLDENGNKHWGENDLKIAESYENHQLRIVQKIDENSFVVGWLNLINTNLASIKFQKIDLNGNKVWGEAGVNLTEPQPHVTLYSISLDENGDITVCCKSNYSSSFDLYNIAFNGNVSESNQFELNSDSNISLKSICSDGESGFIIAGYNEEYELKIFRIDSNGNHIWPAEGYLLKQYDSPYLFIRKVSQNNNLFYHQLSGSEKEILVFDIDGNLQLDLPFPDIDSNPNYSNMVVSQNGEINLLTNQYEYDQSKIIAFRYDLDGNSIFNSDGNVIRQIDNTFSSPISNLQVISDNNNGLLVWWHESDIDGAYSYIYQHVSEEGISFFEEPGQIITESTEWIISKINMFNDKVSAFYTAYSDNYLGYHYQLYDVAGNSYLDDIEPLAKFISTNIYDYEMAHKDGYSINIWEDTRGLKKKLYSQIIDSEGNTLLETNGKLLNSDITWNQDLQTLVNGINNNEFVYSWIESDPETADYIIKCDAIDMEGNNLWSNGSGLALAPVNQTLSNLSYLLSDCYDNNGIDEYIFISNSYNIDMHSVMAYKIIDGENIWEEGVQLNTETEITPLDLVDNYLAYFEITNSYHHNLIVSKFAEDGSFSTEWPENGVIVSEQVHGSVKISKMNQNILVTWINDTGSSNILKAQLLDENGSLLWGEDGVIICETVNLEDYQVAVDGSNFYISWTVPIASYAHDRYIQKFDTSGNPQWSSSTNILLFGAENNSDNILKVLNGKIISVSAGHGDLYDDEGISYGGKVVVQLMNQDGETLLDESGLNILSSDWYLGYLKIDSDEDNLYLSCIDGRAVNGNGDGHWDLTYGIYMQKLNFDYLYSPLEEVEPVQVQLSNYPNPFNPNTTISFTLNTEITEDTEIEIYNIKGQLIRHLPVSTASVNTGGVARSNQSTFTITWDGTDNSNNTVSSGVYLINLKSGDHSLAKSRCILLK